MISALRAALVGLGAIAASLAASTVSAGVLPYVPASPRVVLERVPSSDPRVRQFDELRSRHERAPRDLSSALPLANAYLDYARSTGDARYLGRAMAVIEPWMGATPVPIPVLLVHAILLQSRHAFQASRTELSAIVAHDPRNTQAWLTLASVAMVLGDYAAANRDCVQLAEVGGDLLGVLCTAQLRSLNGRSGQAYALLRLIEDSGPNVPVAIKSYVEGLLADTAVRLGRSAAADQHFKAALQWTPGDNFLLADYADFLLDENRPREVETLLADYTQSDTSFLRLVFAEAAVHDPRAARDITEMKARFAAMDRRGSRVYEREQAMFVLRIEHDPARALHLAEENWTVQRAPQDMRIYLEATLAAGEPRAAEPVLELLARSHLEDPVIAPLSRQIGSTLGSSSEAAPRSIAVPMRGPHRVAGRDAAP